MANFLTGSYIEVLYTDNTVARFPHQIGCLGIVEHAPIHPSTWFTIKMMDGRSIKLQTTAMKHVSKSDSRHQMAQNILLLPAQKQSIVVHAAPTDVPKENHRPRSNSNLGIAHFTKGISVIILRTDNVLHRVPHLVGVVGIIKEVPVHPITWFKIEFPSGQIATFRPSAFKLNDGKDEEVHRPSKKPTAFSANLNQMYAKKTQPAKEKDRSTEHDYTVGMQVAIRSGELKGELGEVLKASNGWIQVITALGKVAKRAHELEYAGHTSEKRDYLYSPIRTAECRPRPHSDIPKALKKASFMSLLKDGVSPQAERCHYFQRSYPSSPNSSSCEEGSKRKHEDLSYSDTNIATPYDLENQSTESSCPFPLIPLHLRQAKRQRFQAFIEREWEENSSRPDLTYWLQEIKCALRDDVYEDPYKTMPRVGAAIQSTSALPYYPINHSSEVYYTEAEMETETETETGSVTGMSVNNSNSQDMCPSSPSSSLCPMDLTGVLASDYLNDMQTSTLVPVMDASESESNNDENEYEIVDENKVESRARSYSISEGTDSEESFSPNQPSHGNVLDFPERSVPSPLTLPPAGSNLNTFTSEMFASMTCMDKKLQTIDSIVSTADSITYKNIKNKSINNNNNTNNKNVNRSLSRTSFSFRNKPEFSIIPNPVKLFLPRQYSCPTFSPFQTSSFSPFASNTKGKQNSSSILKDHSEWENFFSNTYDIDNKNKNKPYIGNNAPFAKSAFLPFTSPIPTGSIE